MINHDSQHLSIYQVYHYRSHYMGYLCVCMSVLVQLSVVCLWNSEVDAEYFPLSFSTLFSKQASLWTGTHRFGYPGWQWAPLHSQRWGCRRAAACSFPMGAADLTRARDLCAELSSQPSFNLFIYKLCIYYFYVQFIHENQGCRELLSEVKQ